LLHDYEKLRPHISALAWSLRVNLDSTAAVDNPVDKELRTYTTMCHQIKHNSLPKKDAATMLLF
jgi:hypothetical protein